MSAHDTSGPRILIVSLRAFKAQAANTSLYEFEDFLCRELGADLYAPRGEFDAFRKVWRLARYVTGSDRLAERVSFYPTEFEPRGSYDLALAAYDGPWNLHLLHSVRGWRERCRVRACYVTEVWPPSLESWRLRREPFASYDCFFIAVPHLVEGFAALANRPCHFLPLAVDMDRFDPFPHAPARSIDAAYLGRRDARLHEALLGWSARGGRFYFYDTAKAQRVFVENHASHRRLYTDLLKRSSYTFAFPAKADLAEETRGLQVIGARYYEFTAAGCIVIGGRPDTDQFRREFGWHDSVVGFDPETDRIEALLGSLDADAERRRSIAARNVAEALRRQDWVYRAQLLLERVGLAGGHALDARVDALRARADALDPELDRPPGAPLRAGADRAAPEG